MRARAEADVRLASPVFQIVARTEARQTPVRDFVVLVAGVREPRARRFIRFGHRVVARNRLGAVTAAARERFFAEPAAFVNFQQVDGNVLGPNFQKARH